MKKWIALLALTVLAPSAAALQYSAAAEVLPGLTPPEHTLVQVKPDAGERCFILPWGGGPTTAAPAPPQVEVLNLANGNLVFTGKPGFYALLSWTDTGQSQQWIEITRSGPLPPDPIPDPDVDPDPPVEEVPFPAPGLTVMVLREDHLVGELPPEQALIFSDQAIFSYLRDKAVRLPDGGPAVRVWDPDYTEAQLAKVDPVLRVAYKNLLEDANGQFPWIGISTGAMGCSEPLPATPDETLTLIKKFGGG